MAFLLPGNLAGIPEEPSFSQAELDQMLAPIALYPDTLLAQILIASTYPLEVVQAARWQRDNPGLEGVALVNQAAEMGWDPSVQSLTAFPEVLSRMNEELEWTQRLGEAFLQQEEEVMDSIQGLRERAYTAGTLQEQEHIRVKREREIIIIESANPQIIYVPYYQPTVVYGGWWWPAYPAVYWAPPVPGRGGAYGFYWGSGIWVSSGFYYSSWDWPRRQIVVNVNHYHYGKRHYGTPTYPRTGATRWQHSAVHRRGTVYRSEHLNQRYGRTFVSTRPSRTTSQATESPAPRVRTFTPRVRTTEDVRSTLAERARRASRENIGTARSAREWSGRGGSDLSRERKETRSGEVERRGTRPGEVERREAVRSRGVQVSPGTTVTPQPRRQMVEGSARTRTVPAHENGAVRRQRVESPWQGRFEGSNPWQKPSVRRGSMDRAERRGRGNLPTPETAPAVPEQGR